MVPLELLRKISLMSPVEVTLNLATTNSHLDKLLGDDNFWEDKFLYDYPQFSDKHKPRHLSWRTLYLDYSRNNIRAIPLYTINTQDMPQLYTYLWIAKKSNLVVVFQMINEVLSTDIQDKTEFAVFVKDNTPGKILNPSGFLAVNRYHDQSIKYPLTIPLWGYIQYIFWQDVEGIMVF